MRLSFTHRTSSFNYSKNAPFVNKIEKTERKYGMDIYVSTYGNDSAAGTKEAPLATLAEAQRRVRDLVKSQLREPITVHVAEGVYSTAPLQFTAEDSGSADCPITYLSEGQAVLNGGIVLSAELFMPVEKEIRNCLSPAAQDAVVCVNLGALGLERADYGEMCAIGSHNSASLYDGAVLSTLNCELFVNDKRQTIARYPNDGFLEFCGIIREGEGWEATTHAKIPHDEWMRMRNPIADIYKIDADTARRAAAWRHKDDLWMFGYPRHDWADMSSPVIEIKEKECSMETKYVSMFGIHQPQLKSDYNNGGKYYLYNVLDELDAPGEWYLDRKAGILYLYPDTNLSSAEILLSLATKPLLQFDGASHLRFCGFTILGTRADGIAGECSDVILDSLLIKNVAGHAVVLNGYRNTVKNCEIKETGRGGIRLDGGDRASLTHGMNVAENNYIHDFSRIFQTYQSGIHLLGCGNIARHNEICNTPHQALGYYGNEHLIEYNYIHDCTYRSSDAGAIYSGFDWAAHGTVIRYNRIENIGADGFRPDGIYWDDGLSGQTAYGNILVNVKKFSVQIGGGHDNIFRHNLIINSGAAAIKFDARYRTAYFSKKQFYSAIEHSGASRTHWVKLEKMPYRSSLWESKFPNLTKIKTDPATDPDDPDYGINPSHCTVQYNAVIAPRGAVYRVDDSVYKYSAVSDNFEYESLEQAGIDIHGCRICEDSKIYTEIPEFERIPIEKIGRY